ncbi:hypothetical protein FDUTEX481_08898 [Tolypothrix sp. PCC 7601]|nr:hypothetical protein FDUTEX481_08898 [Tolypothrix sp. PCC 7601]
MCFIDERMSQITIQCRLVASESTRQQLWKLMAEKNTSLINELLVQVAQNPEFETWRQKGKHPSSIVKELCQPLKTDPRFIGQPARFYTSAIATVNYIYKSWFALIKRSHFQLEGKIRWWEMLKSDTELVELSGMTIESLRSKAAEILAQFTLKSDTVEAKPATENKRKKTKKSKASDSDRSMSKTLFEAYHDTKDILTSCAISYLLKNGCKINDKEEDTQKFAKRRRKLEIQIERLREQLEARIPKGRDLTDAKWLETLLLATRNVPKSELEAKSWQDDLLKKSSKLPFPVGYESNEDMTWFWQFSLYNIAINLRFFWLWIYIDYLIAIVFLRDVLQIEKQWLHNLEINNTSLLIKLWNLALELNCLASILFLHESLHKYKRRLCVQFNGLSKHTFKVYCDFRDLHWFQRFFEDQRIKKNSKNQHSSSLFTLRSGCICWQEHEGKGKEWIVNRLILYCCVDTRLWTAEGTNQVREEKAEEIAKAITRTIARGELNEKQLAFIRRKNSTLARINNPFPRPSQLLYKGQSHILVGVSLGLEKLATVAVVDGSTGKVLTYRSIKQLLGDNYKLLNRQRQQKHTLSHQRQIAQILAAPNQLGESELGQYVDRLLAKEIVAIAQTYKAGSIVLPKLGDMREQVQSEIQAKAEQKSDLIEVQQKYAKEYRVSVHQWSYGRLIANIQTQAAKVGIVIEEAKQPVRVSPQEKAKELAIAAYNYRQKT